MTPTLSERDALVRDHLAICQANPRNARAYLGPMSAGTGLAVIAEWLADIEQRLQALEQDARK